MLARHHQDDMKHLFAISIVAGKWGSSYAIVRYKPWLPVWFWGFWGSEQLTNNGKYMKIPSDQPITPPISQGFCSSSPPTHFSKEFDEAEPDHT